MRLKQAELVLSPANGKRLIAKAVLKHELFRKAKDKSIVILSLGTTNALIYEEIIGKKIDPQSYAAGIVKDTLGVTDAKNRLKPIVLKEGNILDIPWIEALKQMDENSLFIKGANAFDMSRQVGILVGGEGGGTIGEAIGTLVVKKVPFLVPVGVEKRVPSVVESARLLSKSSISTKDMQVGMFVVSNATIITEIEALNTLFDVEAHLVASGGIDGFEGSGIFVIQGEEKNIEEALKTVASIKQA